MNKVFILGATVESYSLSPRMQEFWMKEFGITGSYQAFNVEPENLADKIKQLQSEGYLGGNITIPHKEKALELCTEVSEIATEVGAVNTISFKGEKIIGHNTDIAGLNQNIIGNSSRILILGAGGAARSAILGCQKTLSRAKIIITNRTHDRAEELAKKFGCETVLWEKKEEVLPRADLVINTTSLGMRGELDLDISLFSMKKTGIVYDMIYDPIRTKLLRQAEKLGIQTIDGLWMLVYQGAGAFEKWFPGNRIGFDLLQKTRKFLLEPVI